MNKILTYKKFEAFKAKEKNISILQLNKEILAVEFASLHVEATIKAIQSSSVDGMEWIEDFATI